METRGLRSRDVGRRAGGREEERERKKGHRNKQKSILFHFNSFWKAGKQCFTVTKDTQDCGDI